MKKRMLSLTMVLCMVITLFSTVPVIAEETYENSFNPSITTTYNNHWMNVDFSTENTIEVRGMCGSERYGYIKFELPEIETDKILEASLILTTESVDDPYGLTIDCTAIYNNDWVASDVVYNQNTVLPEEDNETLHIGAVSIADAGTEYTWDVTDYIKADADGNYTFKLHDNDAVEGTVRFYSKNSDYAPRLVIESKSSTLTDTCGDNLTWTLDDGTLTISGEGDMYEYERRQDVPWYSHIESIEHIVVEEGVTSYSEYALLTCHYAKTVTIPNSVTTIENLPMSTYLTDIIVKDENANYCTVDGSLFNKSKTRLVKCATGRHNKGGHYEIPDGVAFVNSGAFSDHTFYEIIIPNSIVLINNEAFNAGHKIDTVFYRGSESDWENVNIGMYNDDIEESQMVYNYLPTPKVMYGDTNGDNIINVNDAVLLVEYIGTLAAGGTLDDSKFPNGEFPGGVDSAKLTADDVINVNDAVLLVEYIGTMAAGGTLDETKFPGGTFPGAVTEETTFYGFSKRAMVIDNPEPEMQIRILTEDGFATYGFAEEVVYNGVAKSGEDFLNRAVENELTLQVVKFTLDSAYRVNSISTSSYDDVLSLYGTYNYMEYNEGEKAFEYGETSVKIDENTLIIHATGENDESGYGFVSHDILNDSDTIESVSVYNVDESGTAEIILTSEYISAIYSGEPLSVFISYGPFDDDLVRDIDLLSKGEPVKLYTESNPAISVLSTGSVCVPRISFRGKVVGFYPFTMVNDGTVELGIYASYNYSIEGTEFVLKDVTDVSDNIVTAGGEEYDLTGATIYFYDARNKYYNFGASVGTLEDVATNFNDETVTDYVMFVHAINGEVIDAMFYINTPIAEQL